MPGSSLSRKILIGIIILFLLSLFGVMGRLAGFLDLASIQIIPGLELWRLLTYPIAPAFVGLLVGSIVFSAPAEEVEQMLGTRSFGILLLVITLVMAVMHTIIFYGRLSPVLAGPVNIALFVLVGFVYLFPQSEIRILFFNVRSWGLLAFIGGGILLYSLYAWLENGGSPLGMFPDGGFGALLGGVYFHARYQKYTFLLRQIRSVERIADRVRSSGSPAAPSTAPRRTPQPQTARIRIPFQKNAGREMSDEERLNMILERINEKSYNALTEDEKKFLSEYSSRLR